MKSQPKAVRTAVKSKESEKNAACRAITARHFRVLEDLLAGMPVCAIAKKNHLTRQSVWNVRQAYRKGGRDALVCTATGGRRPSLTSEDVRRLREALCKGGGADGLPPVWTVAAVTAFARRLFRRRLSQITVRKEMHDPRIGLLGEREAPWLDASGWSPAAVRWVRTDGPALRRRSRREGRVLLAVAVEPVELPAFGPKAPERRVRLTASGGREPARASLLPADAFPLATERFLRSVARAVGRPVRFFLEEGPFVAADAMADFSHRSGIPVVVVPRPRGARGAKG